MSVYLHEAMKLNFILNPNKLGQIKKELKINIVFYPTISKNFDSEHQRKPEGNRKVNIKFYIYISKPWFSIY